MLEVWVRPIFDCGLDPNRVPRHSDSGVSPPMSPWDLWGHQGHHGEQWHPAGVPALVCFPVRPDSTVSGNHLNRVGHPVVLRYAR